MLKRKSVMCTLGLVLLLGGGLAAFEAPVAVQDSQGYLMILSAIDDTAGVGEYTFEVVVVNQDDNPVEDAEVTADLSMAAMPMPGAPYRVTLAPVGRGWYRGVGRLTMTGRWDVSIEARRSVLRGTTTVALEAYSTTEAARDASRP